MKPGRAGAILLPMAAFMGAKEVYDRFQERRAIKPAPLPNVDIVPVYEADTLVMEGISSAERLHDTRSTIFSPQESGIDDFAQLAQSIRNSMPDTQ